ncbi:hypothetical protein PRtIB026_A32020 [Pseudomonas sp. RtIB026]|nr:hypothetical protein PRtIB026_A32020 [Pseudomonas sp. RtIB026]
MVALAGVSLLDPGAALRPIAGKPAPTDRAALKQACAAHGVNANSFFPRQSEAPDTAEFVMAL